MKGRMIAAATILLTGISLSACGPRVYSGGNKPMEEQIAQIKPGEQTRSQVQQILGSPSGRSLYGPETWFYISMTRETFAFLPPEETTRDVLTITFGDDGMVEKVSKLDQSNGREVVISEKKTPTAGHDMNVVEQMVGNIGRFNTTAGKSN